MTRFSRSAVQSVLVPTALSEPASPEEVDENYLFAVLLVNEMDDYATVQPHLTKLRRVIRRYNLQSGGPGGGL
jgi:hypothetical protein